MRIRLAILCCIVLGLTGCHEQIVRRSLETAPGGHEDPQGRHAIVEEMDHCYIDAIDYVPVGKHPDDKFRIEFAPLPKVYYRQFTVRTGTHVLSVRYFITQGTSYSSAGPINVLTRVDSDHVYMLQSQFTKFVVKGFLGMPTDNYYFKAKLVEDTHPIVAQN